MNEMKHIVYQITNLLNNMIYVGKHSTCTPNDMGSYWSHNAPLTNTRKKYGNHNFKRETLFVFNVEDEAYAKEREIVTLEFVARKDTYNLMVGGDGCASGKNHPLWGKHHTEESKKKMREKRELFLSSPEGKKFKEDLSIYFQGHVRSKESCYKQSESMKGKNHWNFGGHLSEEQKKNLSERMSGENHPFYGKRHTEETIQKMKKKKQEFYASSKGEAHRKKLSSINSGESHPMYGKCHTEESKKKMRENHWDQSGPNNPNWGKHPTEETRRKLRENSAMRLSPEIIEQRRKDIKNIEKVWGWKTSLSKKWKLHLTTASKFIKKYAADLV